MSILFHSLIQSLGDYHGFGSDQGQIRELKPVIPNEWQGLNSMYDFQCLTQCTAVQSKAESGVESAWNPSSGMGALTAGPLHKLCSYLNCITELSYYERILL